MHTELLVCTGSSFGDVIFSFISLFHIINDFIFSFCILHLFKIFLKPSIRQGSSVNILGQ